MSNKARLLVIFLCASWLSACTIFEDRESVGYQPYRYGDMQPYPQGSYQDSNYGRVKKPVVVPNSYHVGANYSPVSPKDRDRGWVGRQNPQKYTIEVADGEKASKVAGALHKLPKNQRAAEVKYYRNGKPYYKGLYGSYDSYEDAQQALRSLPDNVKQGAGVKNWGNVQSSVGQ